MTDEQLVNIAADAAGHAHCPYSRFNVGAALLTADGRVFTGVNVENASYGLTMCAERVAIGAAVAAGFRNFAAIAIAAGGEGPVFPCGACRQVLAEFGPPSLRILLAPLRAPRTVRAFVLEDLLPHAFELNPTKG